MLCAPLQTGFDAVEIHSPITYSQPVKSIRSARTLALSGHDNSDPQDSAMSNTVFVNGKQVARLTGIASNASTQKELPLTLLTHPHLMHLPGRHINSRTDAEGLFRWRGIFRVCDCQRAAADKVRGEAAVAVWLIVRMSTHAFSESKVFELELSRLRRLTVRPST